MPPLYDESPRQGSYLRGHEFFRLVSALIVVAAFGGALGFASPVFAWDIHQSPHLEHTTWLFGAKFIQYNAWEPGEGEEQNENVTGFGAGLLVERTVIEGWLEIELFAGGIATDGPTIVPIDVIFKKSFEFGRFNPYLGLGPSISIDVEDGHAEAHAGGAFALGTYIWITDHVGIDFDLEYAIVAKNGTAQELLVAMGPVMRF
jgi:hypothetical protein